MSRLEQLIKELCPNGVEYKKIKDCVGVNRGSRLTKSQLNDAYQYDVYHGSKDTILGKYCDFNAPAKTTIVVNTGGIGGVKYIDENFWCSDGSFWLGQVDYINPKYLYYCLAGYEDYFFSKKRVGGVPTIDKSVVEDFEIPVPPREVQDEIVRILDNFTNLTAELTAELTARKKQYEHYRDSLLTFNSDVKRVKLKDIATDFYRGSGITREQVTNEGFPCIRYGEIYTTYNIYFDKSVSYTNISEIINPKYTENGDLLFAITGESIEDIGKTVAYVGKEKCLVGGDILVMKHNQNPKYLSFALSTTNAIIQKGKGKVKSKVVHTNVESIGNLEIPLPSLEEQERIANILDKYERICNSVTDGIPAEISLRRIQYEHYRDKLLSFKRF